MHSSVCVPVGLALRDALLPLSVIFFVCFCCVAEIFGMGMVASKGASNIQARSLTNLPPLLGQGGARSCTSACWPWALSSSCHV
mmetsp:Transcript_55260/g.120926  ORF Transcript_55260/g.120926 Transcript_55260/m.120926 type:complete len:84 (+) Transcript_55260:2-253(+)